MRALIVWASLIICTSAGAENNSFFQETLDKLSTINESGKDCWFCATTRDPEEQPKWKECLRLSCPPYESDPDYALRQLSNIPRDYPEFFEVRKQLIKALNFKVQERKKENHFLRQALAEKMKVENPTARILANFQFAAKRLAQISVNAGGKIDEQASRKKFFAAGGTELDFQVTKRVMEIYAGAMTEVQPIVSSLSDEELRKLSSEEMKKRLLKALEDHEKNSQRFAAQSGFPIELIINKNENQEVRRQILAGKLQPSRLEELRNSISGSVVVEDMFKPENMKLLSGQPKAIADLVDEAKIKTMLDEDSQIEKIMHEKTDYQNTPMGKRYDDVLINCLGTLGLSYVLSPNDQQVQAFARSEKDLRKTYVDAAKQTLSAHSAALLANEAKKWNLKLPESRAQVLETFKDQIKAVLESQPIEDLEAGASAGKRQVMAVALANRDDLTDPDEYFNDFNDFCFDKAPQSFASHAVFGKGDFYIGSPKVLRGKTLVTNAFHEYTHLASSVMSNNKQISKETSAWYKAVRQCLNEQRHGKKPFEEEDFAETMSNLLAPDEMSYVCANSIDKLSEEDFTLADRPWDPDHSGTIYYFMTRLSMRPGGIPKVCREALAEKGETDLPTNCYAKVKTPVTASASK